MADTQQKPISPISQLLQSIGLTRDDLHRHSDQMRQFLTAESASSLRAFPQETQSTGSTLSKHSSSSNHSRSRSISRSHSAWETSPPVTPVKSEPVEPALSLHNFSSMEMVIERQSRQGKKDKRAKRARERSHTLPAAHHSPSPRQSSSSYPGFSLDSFMQSRDVRRVSASAAPDNDRTATESDAWNPPPVTPQRRSYYRDRNPPQTPASNAQKDTSPSNTSRPQSHYRERSSTFHATTSSTAPVTPQRTNANASPLPSSSPPGLSSSPPSSPNKPIVNEVSSPGPMDPLPLEEDYDNLPYTLPPGPYLTAKPGLSYAALVGQAIISSPQHRLTLQEIYDWITIVYPYFQRGETTWMNSIRHVLSTTACFRKVVRDRSVGRTLWAIWDEDLPCFEGGGFRKQLCRDMEGKTKLGPVRKRTAIEAEGSAKRAKRAKKDKPALPQSHQVYMVPTTHAIPLFPHGPMFPPVRPTPQHQPYYESCLPQQIPAEIIFPPLPPSASYGYHQVLGTAAPVDSTSIPSSDEQPVASTSPKPDEPSCPSSMPELTPNRSSSLSPPLPSDPGPIHEDEVAVRVSSDLATDVEPDGVFNVSTVDALEPSITLLDQGEKKKSAEERKTAKGKGKAKQDKRSLVLPQIPTSPTMNRKTTSKSSKHARNSPLPTTTHAQQDLNIFTSVLRPATSKTPPAGRLCTPPPRQRNHATSNLQISSVRTPLSHKGLHMSPSASLAHYKSNLDPPPPTAFFRNGDGEKLHVDDGEEESENVRTPSRKRSTTAGIFPPITPKRLNFPGTQDSASPFRTPGTRLGASPFRTPGIFDPHDPGALLDEELSRLGAGQTGCDSPAGLFGRNGGGLLYESPNVLSPGRWVRWW